MDHMVLDPAKGDLLILVDGLDRQVGTATKEDAHRRGLLHRAFSVVLVREADGKKELLLSRRAEGKYHSGGLWANSCCSHPRDGEGVTDAAFRRVREELGCGAEGLREIGAFVYRAEFPDGITEYEYDHVLVGRISGEPQPDPSEVSETRWTDPDLLAELFRDRPEIFSAWAYTVLSLALRSLCS